MANGENQDVRTTLSRRRFLKDTTFGVVTLSLSRFLPFNTAEDRVPSEIARELRFFSPKEYLIMAAIADRMVGTLDEKTPSSTQLQTALRADKFLSKADPEIQSQFHQLLMVFNAPVFTFLFDFRFSSFLKMDPADQDSYLEDWMESGIGFRRTAFQALKRTSLSMFYTEPRSWSEIGFGGMDVGG